MKSVYHLISLPSVWLNTLQYNNKNQRGSRSNGTFFKSISDESSSKLRRQNMVINAVMFEGPSYSNFQVIS